MVPAHRVWCLRKEYGACAWSMAHTNALRVWRIRKDHGTSLVHTPYACAMLGFEYDFELDLDSGFPRFTFVCMRFGLWVFTVYTPNFQSTQKVEPSERNRAWYFSPKLKVSSSTAIASLLMRKILRVLEKVKWLRNTLNPPFSITPPPFRVGIFRVEKFLVVNPLQNRQSLNPLSSKGKKLMNGGDWAGYVVILGKLQSEGITQKNLQIRWLPFKNQKSFGFGWIDSGITYCAKILFFRWNCKEYRTKMYYT